MKDDLGRIAAILFLAGAVGAGGLNAGEENIGEGNVSEGAAVYSETCIACHGANGSGELPGMPSLTTKNSPLVKKTPAVLLDHVENGFQSPGTLMGMPPRGGSPSLTDQDLLNALCYMWSEFHPEVLKERPCTNAP